MIEETTSSEKPNAIDIEVISFERLLELHDYLKRSNVMPNENIIPVNQASPWFDPNTETYSSLNGNPCLVGALVRSDGKMRVFHFSEDVVERLWPEVIGESNGSGFCSSGFLRDTGENDRDFLASHGIMVLKPPYQEDTASWPEFTSCTFNLIVYKGITFIAHRTNDYIPTKD